MLPQTTAQLHLPGGRYTDKVDKDIQHKLWKDDTKTYIISKLKLGKLQKLVDWEALGQHH